MLAMMAGLKLCLNPMVPNAAGAKFHTALVEDPDSHHAEEEAKQNTSIGDGDPNEDNFNRKLH